MFGRPELLLFDPVVGIPELILFQSQLNHKCKINFVKLSFFFIRVVFITVVAV